MTLRNYFLLQIAERKNIDEIESVRNTIREKREHLLANIYGNAVQVISPDGSVQTLAKSPDGDGANGGLEAPCEVLLRGNEVIVSNMDFVVDGGVNTKAEPPYTMSVIKLD